MFPHTLPSKRCVRFSICGLIFFYNLLKFDIINADVPFCKRGHNLEMEAKFNRARHTFSNEVSLNVGADVQLIPLEGARKRTKIFKLNLQFYFIAKKTKSVSRDFYD